MVTCHDDDMQIHEVARRDKFESVLATSKVNVTFAMKFSYETSMEFSWMGRAYTFNVLAWKARGFDKFVKLFHQFTPRDPDVYGNITEGVDGQPLINMDTEHKGNAIFQGCQDIMICLNKIFTCYQSSIMDYAMWYRENHKEETDYSSYITLRTCHCIVHSELFSPCTPRTLIKF